MRIAFGWYTFKIKSYNPKDLGIEYKEKDNVTFEVRQRCFHLFFIPFFGMGKVFALRKEGKLYDLPDEYISLITKQRKHTTPFYTFSLPILLIAGFLFYFINREIKESEGHQYLQTQYTYKLNQIEKEISHLTSDHYIEIKDYSNLDNSNHHLYLKVEEVKNDSLKLFLIETTPERDKSLPYFLYVKDIYSRNREKLDPFFLTKDELRKAICKDYNSYYNKTATGHNLLNDGNNYVIEELLYMKGPLIRVEHSYQLHEILLTNNGEPVELVEIKKIEGNITCIDSLPLYIPTNSNFLLEMNNFYLEDFVPNKYAEYTCFLVFEDMKSNQYTYKLYSKNAETKVERVVK